MTVQSDMENLHGQHRREAIIDAALALFAEHGVEGTSMKMLATRAGISTGLTYHYFKNKAALLDQVIAARGVSFPQLSDRHQESIQVVLPEFALELSEQLQQRLDVIWLFFREYRSSPTVAERISQKRERSVQELAAYLEARQEAGEVRDISPEAASRGLLGCLFQTHLDQRPGEEYLLALVDIFLTGIKL